MIDSTPNSFLEDFRKIVCGTIELHQEGINRYRVSTPFLFQDGDEFVIYLRREDDRWFLVDEGHTFMHLSYWMDMEDLESGERKDLIEATLEQHGLEENDGEIRVPLKSGEYGSALFSYIQGITRISDVDMLNKVRVQRTFLEDFKKLMSEKFGGKAQMNWTDLEKDRQEFYNVDCRLETGNTPFFVYAVWSDERANNATVSIMKYREWETRFNPVVIYENVDNLTKKITKKLMVEAGKQFPSFYGEEEGIANYFAREMSTDY